MKDAAARRQAALLLHKKRPPQAEPAAGVQMMHRDGRRLQIALELLHHVGVLPGQIHVGAAEVAIGGGLLVDGAAEI